MSLTDCRRIAFAGLLALATSPAGATLFQITTNTNWSAIVGGPPTAADTILVKNGATLTVNVANAVVGAITLGGAAPTAGQGTLSFGANTSAVSITTASGQAGTLTLGSGGQAGNLNMANGGTLTLQAFVSSTVGTFTRNATGTTGTVVLTGTSTLPTGGAYNTFNNLSVSAGTTTLSQNLTVAGNLDVSGTMDTSTRTFAVSGNANIGGTLTLTNTTTITGTTTIGGTLNISSATGTKTFVGDVTIGGGATWNSTVAGNVFIQGDFTNNGSFTSGTSTYLFNGTTGQQTLSGPNGGATSFINFTLNNGNGLLLSNGHNLTVTTFITLTAGKITTGASTVYVSNGSAVAGAQTGRFIEGNLKKPFSSAALTRAFEVGGNTSNAYSPVSITFASVTGTGDITVRSTALDHPQVSTPGTSGIDAAVSLNRWWTITNNSVTGGTYIAAFTYVATDIDGSGTCATGTACPAAFVAMRYDGADWNITTLAAPPTTTGTTITGESGFGDFAIGEPSEYNINRCTICPSVGRWNAYDPPPTTPTGSVQGFIRTKTAATAFTLRIVHMDNSGLALQNVNKDSIRIDFLDASNTGGTYTNNCSDAWPVIATLNTAYTANANFVDIPFPATFVTNSYPSVRVKVTRTSGGTESGCSGDRFAIKPNDLVLQAYDTTWQTAGTKPGTDRVLNNTGATGGNVHAASTGSGTLRPFTVRATPRNAATPTPQTTTNYAGTPTVFSGYPTCGTQPSTGCTVGALVLGSWGPTTGFPGVRSADAHYSEAGTFNLRLEDRTFANVDVIDTTLANRTISQASPSPREIGRFVPDHFDVAATTSPTFQTFATNDASCQLPTAGTKRSFTYVGQAFGYVTTPVATLAPKNGGGGTVANYTNNLWKIGNITGSSVSQAKDCTSNPDICIFTTTWSIGTANSKVVETYTYTLAPVSTPNWDNGQVVNTAASVNTTTGVITFASSDTLAFKRSTSTPLGIFTANITDTISVQDTSESGTTGNPASIGTTTAATFSSIAFDAGNEFRYGRLRMVNGFGSQNVALPVGIETQYWNGTAFQTNSADNCTTLARSTITLGDYRPNLAACETAVTQATVTFTEGVGQLYLTAPGATALTGAAGTPVAGSVLLTPNLGSAATGNFCAAVGGAQAAATAAGKAYLQGAWTGATYTEDPSARGTFGFYGAQPRNFIYFRENY